MLAEMPQAIFRSSRITFPELLIEPLSPGIELPQVLRLQNEGKGSVNRGTTGNFSIGIDEGMKDNLQVVRQRPSDSLNNERPFSLIQGESVARSE